MEQKPLVFICKNWKGKVGVRRVIPKNIYWGKYRIPPRGAVVNGSLRHRKESRQNICYKQYIRIY